jgi:hypothetical protein
MNQYSDILQLLSEAPDDQISKGITPKLKQLSAQDSVQSDELLDVIDDCVFFGGASEFAMLALDTVWKQMLDVEGITKEQAQLAAEPRRKKKEASM